MDFTRLRVLAAVAREGSVTAAADALQYAQPSVSHHLARLEAEVGIPLVQRVGRGIRLTEAGQLLAVRAEEILGRVASTRAELDAHAGLRAGRVRLAAFPSALATLVPPVAAWLAAEHPGLELALVELEPPEALAALRRGDVDVALIFEHADHDGPPSGVSTLELFAEPIYLVTAKDHRWAGPRAELATFAGQRWIAGCARCRTHLLDSCRQAGFTPTIEFETDDYVAAQALVAAGMGVTTLPGLALLANRHAGVQIDRIPGDRRRVLVATYGRPPLALPVQALMDTLTTAVPTPQWPRG